VSLLLSWPPELHNGDATKFSFVSVFAVVKPFEAQLAQVYAQNQPFRDFAEYQKYEEKGHFLGLRGIKMIENPSYFFTQIESAKCFWSNSSAPTIVNMGSKFVTGQYPPKNALCLPPWKNSDLRRRKAEALNQNEILQMQSQKE
jgi:hypothetical protein